MISLETLGYFTTEPGSRKIQVGHLARVVVGLAEVIRTLAKR
jgi:hypothetical protein